MIEYDGCIPVRYRSTMEDFLNYHGNRASEFINFTERYLMGDYKEFIATRREELNITGMKAKFYNLFTIGYSFTPNDKHWRNMKKVLKQIRHLSVIKNKSKYKENEESFYINEYTFNQMKEVWKEYIEYTEELLIKRDPQYKMKKSIKNF